MENESQSQGDELIPGDEKLKHKEKKTEVRKMVKKTETEKYMKERMVDQRRIDEYKSNGWRVKKNGKVKGNLVTMEREETITRVIEVEE